MTLYDYEGTDSSFYNRIIFVLENYGWYLLIASVLLLYIYRKMEPFIYEYMENKKKAAHAAECHKYPDLFTAKLVAQQEYASKLQDRYTIEASKYQEKKEERETKKREEWLSKQKGHRLGTGKESTLKPEYNPLIGDTSRSYRAQRKTPCSGGGCGK